MWPVATSADKSSMPGRAAGFCRITSNSRSMACSTALRMSIAASIACASASVISGEQTRRILPPLRANCATAGPVRLKTVERK